MKQHILLLAGGKGKRLWPFSRENTPKQFIKLPTGKTLLENTLDRVVTLNEFEKYIVITQQHYPLTQPIAQHYNVRCLIEPESRNTAPAIAWSIRELCKNNQDGVVVIMPTDHIILNTTAFHKALLQAANYAIHHDVVLLFGAPQKYVTSRFGVISHAQHHASTDNEFPVYSIEKFHEKPVKADALHYITQPHTAWNMGIFVGRLSVIWKLFLEYAPHIIANLDNYDALIPQSFDKAIIEQAPHQLAMIKYDFGWNDIGSLNEFMPAWPDATKKYIEIAEAHSNSVVAQKSVILAGVSDLVIVEMDDMILVTRSDLAQSPELLTKYIRDNGWENLL